MEVCLGYKRQVSGGAGRECCCWTPALFVLRGWDQRVNSMFNISSQRQNMTPRSSAEANSTLEESTLFYRARCEHTVFFKNIALQQLSSPIPKSTLTKGTQRMLQPQIKVSLRVKNI